MAIGLVDNSIYTEPYYQYPTGTTIQVTDHYNSQGEVESFEFEHWFPEKAIDAVFEKFGQENGYRAMFFFDAVILAPTIIFMKTSTLNQSNVSDDYFKSTLNWLRLLEHLVYYSSSEKWGEWPDQWEFQHFDCTNKSAYLEWALSNSLLREAIHHFFSNVSATPDHNHVKICDIGSRYWHAYLRVKELPICGESSQVRYIEATEFTLKTGNDYFDFDGVWSYLNSKKYSQYDHIHSTVNDGLRGLTKEWRWHRASDSWSNIRENLPKDWEENCFSWGGWNSCIYAYLRQGGGGAGVNTRSHQDSLCYTCKKQKQCPFKKGHALRESLRMLNADCKVVYKEIALRNGSVKRFPVYIVDHCLHYQKSLK